MTAEELIRPATDEQLAAWKELGAMGRIFIPADVVDRLAARIEADAAEVEQLRGEKRYTVEQIQAACPACDGKGGTRSTRYAHACRGDDQRCAVMCPVPEEDWEQCEYCGRLLAALDESEVPRG